MSDREALAGLIVGALDHPGAFVAFSDQEQPSLDDVILDGHGFDLLAAADAIIAAGWTRKDQHDVE